MRVFQQRQIVGDETFVGGQDFSAGAGYEDVIFDSNTEFAGDIYTRFDGDNITRV